MTASNSLSSRSEPRIAVYVRIASVLKTQILRGTLQRGDRVPSIDDLCAQYGIARATARQVLQLLVTEGLITSERGRGSHVTYERPPHQPQPDGLFQLIAPTPADHEIRVLHRALVSTLPNEFGVVEPVAERYVHIRKLHLQAGLPYGVFDLYVDADTYALFPDGADNTEKIFVLMHRHAGIRAARGRERLLVEPADWDEARWLDYQVGMPVARVVRIIFDASGKVVYAASNSYRGDRFRQERAHIRYVYGGGGEVIGETSETSRASSAVQSIDVENTP